MLLCNTGDVTCLFSRFLIVLLVFSMDRTAHINVMACLDRTGAILTLSLLGLFLVGLRNESREDSSFGFFHGVYLGVVHHHLVLTIVMTKRVGVMLEAQGLNILYSCCQEEGSLETCESHLN